MHKITGLLVMLTLGICHGASAQPLHSLSAEELRTEMMGTWHMEEIAEMYPEGAGLEVFHRGVPKITLTLTAGDELILDYGDGDVEALRVRYSDSDAGFGSLLTRMSLGRPVRMIPLWSDTTGNELHMLWHSYDEDDVAYVRMVRSGVQSDPQFALKVPYDDLVGEYVNDATLYEDFDEVTYRMMETERGFEVGDLFVLDVYEANLFTQYDDSNAEAVGYVVNTLNRDAPPLSRPERGQILLLLPQTPSELSRTEGISAKERFGRDALVFGKYAGVNFGFPTLLVEKIAFQATGFVTEDFIPIEGSIPETFSHIEYFGK